MRSRGNLMYDVLFTETAIKQMKKLDGSVQKRIIKSLERIRIRPEAFVTRLVGQPYFRLRVGDYRVILDIKGSQLIILVVYIGHRRNVYKNN